MIITTERLYLRPLTTDDLSDLFNKIYSDAETMKFIRDGNARTIDETEVVLNTLITHYKEHGFGFLAVEDKNSKTFVGISGIKYLDTTGEIEVGFLFEKQHWGKGYATETASALIDYVFTTLGKSKVVAITRPDNAASKKVLENCGLKYVSNRNFYNIDFAYFEKGL